MSSAVSAAAKFVSLALPAEFFPLRDLPPLLRLGDFLPGERDFLRFGDPLFFGDLDFRDLLCDLFFGDFDLLFFGDLDLLFFGDLLFDFFGDLLFDFLGDLLFDFLGDLLFLGEALFFEGDFFAFPFLRGDFLAERGDFFEDLLREVDFLPRFLSGLLPRFVSFSALLSLASASLVPAAMLTCLTR